MNPDEYAKLDEIDARHWFYSGKREIVRRWLRRFLDLGKNDLLVDAGCGTGSFLVEMAPLCRTVGLDDAGESLALTRAKIAGHRGRVLLTSLDRIGLADGVATVVTALDVLEHLDDDRVAARELLRLLRPGGILVATVPAYRSLWSDWDVALHHRRRYRKEELRTLFEREGGELLRCAYYNVLALPAVIAIRMWRKLRPLPPGAKRAEDKLPQSLLNRLLFKALVIPSCWSWLSPPAGLAILAIVRRPNDR